MQMLKIFTRDDTILTKMSSFMNLCNSLVCKMHTQETLVSEMPEKYVNFNLFLKLFYMSFYCLLDI